MFLASLASARRLDVPNLTEESPSPFDELQILT
jgi:hypothetical protein